MYTAKVLIDTFYYKNQETRQIAFVMVGNVLPLINGIAMKIGIGIMYS